MMPELQRTLGETLCRARRIGQRLLLPDGDWSLFDELDALAVQRVQETQLGWFPDSHPPAWKLGGSPACGRVAAPVAGDVLQDSPFVCPPGYAVGYGIEAELALRLASDLPADADEAAARQAIDCFFPCIELCDTRIESREPIPAALQLADQLSNRAIILGPPVRYADPPDWARLSVNVSANGSVRHSGQGGHPFIDPLGALPWLAQHATDRYDGLRAGDIIATGSFSGIYWATAGERIRVSLGGIGTVDLRVAA